MRDLTQHLTTRADDNHAPPVSLLRREIELNHILHCLCGPPSIPLSFNLAVVLPRWITYCVNCGTEGVNPPTPSNHRLRCGLPGYLILFATHTFEPQRQLVPSRPPSPLVFLPISTHSTATPGIPPTSALLKKNSFESSSWVEPMDFTSNLFCFPHCAIFPTAASRRSLGRVSVPMWPFNLSVRLPIVALVGRYLTN